MEGIIIAVEALNRHCKKLKYAKSIYVFSSTPAEMHLEDAGSIKSKISEMGVNMNLMYLIPA